MYKEGSSMYIPLHENWSSLRINPDRHIHDCPSLPTALNKQKWAHRLFSHVLDPAGGTHNIHGHIMSQIYCSLYITPSVKWGHLSNRDTSSGPTLYITLK